MNARIKRLIKEYDLNTSNVNLQSTAVTININGIGVFKYI